MLSALSSYVVTAKNIAQRTRAKLSAVSSVPGPRGNLVLGNIRQVPHSQTHLILEQWADEYGPIYRIRFGHMPMLVVSDPDLVRDALKRRPDDFRRLRTMARVLREMGVAGVFAAEGDDWRRQRRLIMPAFKRTRMVAALPSIQRMVARLRDLWRREHGVARNIRGDYARFTADTAAMVAFGVDLNTIEGTSALRANIDTVFSEVGRRIRSPIPYWRYMKRSRDRACDRAMAELDRTVRDILRAPRIDAERTTLLDGMRDARLEEDDKRGLSEDELVANIFTMLLAGEDTTASALAWMTDALARHPEVQTRMRDEVVQVLGDHGTLESIEQADRLPYVTAVFRESLRLRSPAPFIYLEAARPVRLGALDLPEGLPVVLLTRCASLRDDQFDDARAFRPERWLDIDKQPAAYAPFGGGPRLCPGLHLSLLEAQCVMGMLLSNFEVTASESDPPDERVGFTMQPKRMSITLSARPTGR